MTDKSYIGKGVVYVENDDGQLVDVGNVTAFGYSASEDKKELKNFRTSGGGNYNAITRIEAVVVTLTMSDFSKENLAIGGFGEASQEAAGSVSNEAQTTPADVSVDLLVPTDFVIDTAQTVTVVGYTEGTDFEVRAAGILVLAAGSIPASTALDISYTKKAVDVVEAFVKAAQDRRIVLDGLNEAQGSSPVVIDVHRFKAGPAQDVQFIGDEFGELAVEGEALLDATKTGTNISQYLKIRAA